MKKIILSILIFGFSVAMYGQRNCGTMDVLDMMQKEDPFLEQRMEQIEEFTNKLVENNRA